MDLSVFTAKFVDEARERLKSLGNALVRLEEKPDSPPVVAQILREAHSLKGSAQMLGFVDIAQIAHQLEDLFIAAKRDAGVVDRRAFDLVFRSLDLIAARVEDLARRTAKPPASQGPEGQPDKTSARGSRKAPAAGQSLRVAVEKLESLTHLAPEMVIESLNSAERHSELRRVEHMIVRLRDQVREARLAPPVRSRLAELGDYADALDAILRRTRSLVTNAGDDHVRLTLITEELRQHVIDLTMLPCATVFDTFPRAVRDLARSCNKEVELSLAGSEIELDKRVIERIADPLVHLVRNAIDHGLESPAERTAAGKPSSGSLRISATQQGNRVQIAVRDDGRGIDPAAIRATAIRRGLAAEADVALWPDDRVFGLIFEPGFSTKTETTDVSGRGVGMDVVREAADACGGVVRVQSEIGRGTNVILDLPLSLALVRVVLVVSAGDITAVPTAALRRILHVPPGDHAEVEGESVPVAPLTTLLGQPRSATPPSQQPALLLETRDGRIAVLVDEVLQEQEVVFQELRGPMLGELAIAGAALLGNGDIVPILDVQRLYERVITPSEAVTLSPSQPATERVRAARVLIVEDSIVAAEMYRGILTAAGFDAAMTHDGVDGLQLVREREFDVVVSDVDMPKMNGIELTTAIRGDARLRDLPVIIVTSRESGDDRRRGAAAGVDAYLTKGDFDQHELIGAVQRVLAARGKRSTT